MDTSSPLSTDSQSAARLSELLEQLKASRKRPEFGFGYWRAWILAAGFGVAAFIQSHDTFFYYFGVLSVLIFMHDSSERHKQHQIDLITDLIEDLRRQKV